MKTNYIRMKIGQLGILSRGVTYSPPEDLRSESDSTSIWLLRSTNLQGGEINLDDVTIVAAHCAKPNQRLANGDIAICTANGSKALVGKASLVCLPNPSQYVVGAFCARMRPNDGESPEFLAALFESGFYKSWIGRLLAGTNINNLKPSDIASCSIRMPSSLAQRNRLGEIFSLSRLQIKTLDRLIAAKREQKRGLMQQLLTGKLRFPGFTEPWKTVRLGDVAEIKFSNVNKHSVEGERVVRLCNYMDVFKNRYINDQMPFMTATATEHEIQKFALHVGDVAITKDSETPDEIGIPALIDATASDLLLGYHLALLRPNKKILEPAFLVLLLESDLIRAHFQRSAKGLTRFALSVGAVTSTPIQLPTLLEQQAIARLYRNCVIEEGLLLKQRAAFAAQRRGLMEKLLSGEIDIQNPKETAA